MLETLLSTSTTADSLTTLEFVGLIAWALVLGTALALAYRYRSASTRSFLVTLVTLPAIVCVTIIMVNGNLGAGVAVAGTFSLVRFRSVPGQARDISFVFLAMCVGLICGMGYPGYALITTLVIGGVNLLLQAAGAGHRSASRDRTLRVTVPEDLDFAGMFDDVLGRYCTYSELTSVKTTNMGSLYKLTYNVGLREPGHEKELIDEIRCRNGNLEVALSHQEVSVNEL